MATTYRYIVYNILEGLKSAFPDADIQEPQVFYWVQVVSNLFRKRHLQSTPSGAYLTKFSGVPVLYDGSRQYVELPAAIYDYIYEKGVEYMSYDLPVNTPPAFVQTFFQFVRAAEAFRLYYNPYESPSPSNPYAYRMNTRLYLLGTEKVSLKTLELGLYAALDPRITKYDLDTESGLNSEQVHQVTLEVLNMGRWVMSVPTFREETGSDGRNMPGTTQGLKSGMPPTQEEQNEEQANV